jgi:dihydrolipoamide dehydrogenase
MSMSAKSSSRHRRRPGGYPAALHAADHGSRPWSDEDPKLGGVCLNRGCIPSKALLHVAKVIREAHESAAWGITFGEPKTRPGQAAGVRPGQGRHRLTGGVGMLSKGRGVEVVRGHATFRTRTP